MKIKYRLTALLAAIACSTAIAFAHNAAGDCKTDIDGGCANSFSCKVTVNGNQITGKCTEYQISAGYDSTLNCSCE